MLNGYCSRGALVCALLMFVVACPSSSSPQAPNNVVVDAGADAGVDDIGLDAGADLGRKDMGQGLACRVTDSCGLCEDKGATAAQLKAAREGLASLTMGLDGSPIKADVAEDTNGRIEVALSADAFAVVMGRRGALVAATSFGQGKVVAFSGQDFLSSGTRSTLLGESGVKVLLGNAVRWTGRAGKATPKLLVANEALKGVFGEQGFADVEVVTLRERAGLREIYDWSAQALQGADLAVVQVNEWGTLMLDAQDVPALRAFVQAGGGLIVATSALHWSWWLADQSAKNPADMLLEGMGLSWARESDKQTSMAKVVGAEDGGALPLWCDYVDGEPIKAVDYLRMASLFESAGALTTRAELERALKRLVRETPALPVSAADPKARLSAQVGMGLVGHAWPMPHPWAATFPGVPTSGVVKDGEVVIETSFKRGRPLGFYAAPGAVVTVSVPAEHVGKGLRVRVGEYHDALENIEDVTQWRRAPKLFAVSPVDAPTLKVGTGLGGSLYLEVPDDYADGSLRVRVEGALPQAVYSRGVSDVQAFKAALRGPAPVALLEERGKVRLVVSAQAARAVEAPDEVMSFWTGFYDSHARLAKEPSARKHESHWLFDPQVGYGYANATPERINHPALAAGWALRTKTGDEDWWLFAHELGHQFQTADWTGGGITEVAVNLFSMYTINAYINAGGARGSAGFKENKIDHASLVGLNWERAGLFERLELYRQLVFEFGWPVFEQVFASYYSAQYPRAVYGGHLDGFAIRFSAISGRDVSGFLKAWGYPLSVEAEATIRSFALPAWLPPGW